MEYVMLRSRLALDANNRKKSLVSNHAIVSPNFPKRLAKFIFKGGGRFVKKYYKIIRDHNHDHQSMMSCIKAENVAKNNLTLVKVKNSFALSQTKYKGE